jgi:formylmethanofuran--tetrahydromethanopterin N-formyltransferase
MADAANAGLVAAESAVEAVLGKVEGVIMSFPGGVCRSGSKVGSLKYKLPASTNQPFCPTLRSIVPETQIPENVKCVYELIYNGVNLASVKMAMKLGIEAAAKTPGVVKISAANFGGKLGPYKIQLKKLGLSL